MLFGNRSIQNNSTGSLTEAMNQKSENRFRLGKKFTKIVHNSTFRLVFLYFSLFILSSLILMGFIYWSTVGYIYQQFDHHIEYDMIRLQTIYNNSGKEKLIEAIEFSLQQKNYDSIYLLYNKKTAKILTGNLIKIPDVKREGWQIIELSGYTKEPFQQDHSARVLIVSLTKDLILINGLDLQSVHRQEHVIFNSLIAGIAVIVLLGALGGFIISISTIKKINLINNTIKEISEGNLSIRIPTRGTDDDYDLLSDNINQMLNQIHKLMQGIQNISNNIAHDLRTPLTRLRGRLELIQKDCGQLTSKEITDALAETDNLLSTFNAMLRINKVESGAQKGHFINLSIDRLLNDVVEFYEPLAEEKEIFLELQIEKNNMIQADRDMIFQVFTNILDNAIKYTPRHGTITINSHRIKGHNFEHVQVVITDTGIGIPKKERQRVFEPFYRLESHRDHQGNGLGLSLVNVIVKLHKGTIELRDNSPGLTFCITLPLGT